MEQPDLLLVCRAGFEHELIAELAARGGGGRARHVAAGLVAVSGDAPECVFERQRLPRPDFTPVAQLKPISDETLGVVFGRVLADRQPWRLHAYVPAGESQPEIARRLDGIAGALLRLARKVSSDIQDRIRDDAPRVVQLCLTAEGLWSATHDAAALTAPQAGGEFRMRMDRGAPSRSYLKLEEAFARMGLEPRPGETVVDLGAAPGGWTFACARRGAEVTAVDHGPLHLPPPLPGWGSITHLRTNGIVFEPRGTVPVDWLVADMLVAPGVALGLLRRWLTRRLARHAVVNVKIPQEDAFTAIAPVLRFVDGLPPAWNIRVKQLYHDRREVTVLAALRAASTGPDRDLPSRG